MVDPSTYQVADHLTTSGGKVWWKFTYNGSALPQASTHIKPTTHQQRLTINRRVACRALRST